MTAAEHSMLMNPHSAYVRHPLHCRWHHIHSINKTTVFIMSHPLQAWYHGPCIRHCTHCIFVITYPLFYDIIPTLRVTPYALHITSYQLLMSSHYCTYNITASICMTPYALHMTSHPLFMTSHHFIYDVKSTISNITLSDLTSTVSV